MERILDIGGYGVRVRAETGWLVVESGAGERTGVPIRDVAVVVLSTPAATVSGAVLSEVAEAGGVVVVCGRERMPTGLLEPLGAHSRRTGVLRMQVAARPLLKARLWRRIVAAKIRSQARLLADCGLRDGELEAMARRVRRGDEGNAEAHAANRYWKRLGLFVRRDRKAGDANALFNYAYAVLHAATVRALCGAGLEPGLGLKHRGAGNPHVLASDVMEPFRTAADRAVRGWVLEHPGDCGLSPASRGWLLRGLQESRWKTASGTLPLFEALNRTAVALRECLAANSAELAIPVLV